MAWLYADFETLDSAARLAGLRKHIAEVEASIGANVGADDKSVDYGVLEAKLARLYERLRELESSPSARSSGGVSYLRYT